VRRPRRRSPNYRRAASGTLSDPLGPLRRPHPPNDRRTLNRVQLGAHHAAGDLSRKLRVCRDSVNLSADDSRSLQEHATHVAGVREKQAELLRAEIDDYVLFAEGEFDLRRVGQDRKARKPDASRRPTLTSPPTADRWSGSCLRRGARSPRAVRRSHDHNPGRARPRA
jgi:hypothetical protein